MNKKTRTSLIDMGDGKQIYTEMIQAEWSYRQVSAAWARIPVTYRKGWNSGNGMKGIMKDTRGILVITLCVGILQKNTML